MIKWSILILSVPNRVVDLMMPLYNKLLSQLGDRKDVEILCLVDNKSMTIGEKRNKLLSCARGEYLSFLDDDDDVADTFIQDILSLMAAVTEQESKLLAAKAINHANGVDVFTFNQHCNVNGQEFFVNFGLTNQNQPAILDGKFNGTITRKPYHMCVWRSILAKNTVFPDSSYGEDLAWITQLAMKCKTSCHIDKVLHYYRFSDKTSESIKFRK